MKTNPKDEISTLLVNAVDSHPWGRGFESPTLEIIHLFG